MPPKCKVITGTDGPGGSSSVPDDIWAREFDSIMSVPASPRSLAVSFTIDMLCVTILNSVPKHEGQRFYYLNTQIHPYIRAADGLVWITGMKSLPQTSIHWMFHWFSCMCLESPLLSAAQSSPAPYKPRWVLGYLCSATAGQMAGISNEELWNNLKNWKFQQ